MANNGSNEKGWPCPVRADGCARQTGVRGWDSVVQSGTMDYGDGASKRKEVSSWSWAVEGQWWRVLCREQI
ncbi:hypothetical protein GOP47_0028396 [Adiantum capillus-veneris]|nr:hypothetical protein GOP47_0028396 [Adiantum capillus-veneris]